MPKEASVLSTEEIKHHRRAFQVPLTEAEKAFLLDAKDPADSLAGFIRDAAIAFAGRRLKRTFSED